MARFINNKNYYSEGLRVLNPGFTGNVFTVTYKSGSVIIISDVYNPEFKVKCSLESTPNMDIITLPNKKLIWRSLCQEKLENGKFEKITVPEYEDFEF